MDIVWKPVKNLSNGRFGYKPEAIVVHIAEGWLNGAYEWFNNSASNASAHYMVGKNGVIWQFVADEDTAWHAGGVNQPRWALLKPRINPNLYTIGIEHEGFTGEKWTKEMYEASGELIAMLCSKYQIPLDRNHIIGHNQINSVTRSRCPGDGVDLDKLIEIAKTKSDDPMVVKELNEKIASLEERVNSLEEKNSDLENDNKIIKDKNEKLQSLVKSYADTPFEVNDLKKLTTKLKDQKKQLEEENSKLKGRVKELEELAQEEPEEKEEEVKENWWEVLVNFIRGT